MTLSAPKQIVFIIAAVLALLGIVAAFIAIPVVSGNAFWFVAVGFILLALGNLLNGL